MDFVSTLVQNPHILELLPLTAARDETLGEVGLSPQSSSAEAGDPVREDFEFLFEPSPDTVLENLLPRLVEMQLYQALLENNAAEHSARMVAMKNATDAAKELKEELTLEFNKIRQAAITTEISEIVGGQAGLKA